MEAFLTFLARRVARFISLPEGAGKDSAMSTSRTIVPNLRLGWYLSDEKIRMLAKLISILRTASDTFGHPRAAPWCDHVYVEDLSNAHNT